MDDKRELPEAVKEKLKELQEVFALAMRDQNLAAACVAVSVEVNYMNGASTVHATCKGISMEKAAEELSKITGAPADQLLAEMKAARPDLAIPDRKSSGIPAGIPKPAEPLGPAKTVAEDALLDAVLAAREKGKAKKGRRKS
jgi:hypothetical protein